MLYRLKLALSRFMYGRYGVDRLNRALLLIYLIIAVLSFALSFISDSVIIYLAFNLLTWAILVIAFMRMLSRNIYARQRENAAYLRIIGSFLNRLTVISGNIRQRDKKYVICKSCKAVIRFPRRKGVHSAECPKCKAKMTVKI